MVVTQEGAQPTASESSRGYSCSLCKRAFEHEASAKRHYYYCRSKPADTKGSRRRSCAACVRAKARCRWPADIGLGACIRCKKRNAPCEYDTTDTPSKVPDQAGEGVALDIPIQEEPNAPIQESSVALVSTRIPDNELNASELEFLGSLDVTLDDLGLGAEQIPHQQFKSMSLACRSLAGLPTATLGPLSPWAYQRLDISLFTTRAFTKPAHVALVSLAMRLLRSYPSMMLTKGTPLPFVHSSSYSWAQPGEGYHPRQSLANCSKLVASLKSQNTASGSNWAWGQIWHAQEQILAEYPNYDRWELLDALQALLVFCLLRLQSAPIGHAVFDVSLLTTVSLVSQALNSSVGEHFDCSIAEDPAPAWRDWIFLESRRRTVLLFQILGLLVDISTAVSYLSIGGLVLVPLPCSAALWTTRDFEQWKLEYKNWHEKPAGYGLSETGNLHILQRTDNGIASIPVEWERWSAEASDLAVLVMIIGELLKNQ
ncbi:hypothetical protein NUW58_g1355 [Xylaria curta]|uniref:Uncharacterized protein n=1 Tax=Xylaria curta TaxID=42375 RepID=A0ACC1PNA4_9PEZI|nr:hypothetical protein NUW58_g1355 [Xylaria curta]